MEEFIISISSILSRPLSIQGCFLGSEMNMLKLFQEGNTKDVKELLKRGLNPNSKFIHPKYENQSLLSFVILNRKRLAFIEILLEHGASEISQAAINMTMFLLTSSHLEIAAQLFFYFLTLYGRKL